ncbi:hypothetical protein [Mesorhizobium sp.]|uniref:hypothetical protein n=1 Tax=Mesorhizobium sp. TaxID=1871066 RepID=UPI0025DDE597|nr:hypothetical protein [Mesorhizobium sp.]
MARAAAESAPRNGRRSVGLNSFTTAMVGFNGGSAVGEKPGAQIVGDQHHGKTPCQNSSS